MDESIVVVALEMQRIAKCDPKYLKTPVIVGYARVNPASTEYVQPEECNGATERWPCQVLFSTVDPKQAEYDRSRSMLKDLLSWVKR